MLVCEGAILVSLSNEKYHYQLNLRLLLEQAPTSEETKHLHQIISKALYAEGYNFLIWEQPIQKPNEN